MPGIWTINAGGASKNVQRQYIIDAGGAGREVFQAFAINASGASQRVFPALAAISARSPTTGSTAGGFTVTLTGTGFLNATSVRVNSTTVACKVVSNTQITFTMPATGAGTQTLYVVNRAGVSNGVAITTLVPNLTLFSNGSWNAAAGGWGTSYNLNSRDSWVDGNNIYAYTWGSWGTQMMTVSATNNAINLTNFKSLSIGMLSCNIGYGNAGIYGSTVVGLSTLRNPAGNGTNELAVETFVANCAVVAGYRWTSGTYSSPVTLSTTALTGAYYLVFGVYNYGRENQSYLAGPIVLNG